MTNNFKVTRKAMRPASKEIRCFYCQQSVGDYHKKDCVLINKRVKVKATVIYEIEVPDDWDKEQIEYHRNDGTWCADNLLSELDSLAEKNGCLCDSVKFECLSDKGEAFLNE